MPTDRRIVLSAILAMSLVLAVAFLFGVIWTVFFAITVAYVARPVYLGLVRRGVPRRWASVVTTSGVFVAAVGLVSPLVFVLYVNRTPLVAFLQGLPARIPVEAMGYTYVIDVGTVSTATVSLLRETAVAALGLAPLLAIKLALFTVLVYSLLLNGSRAKAAALSVVPDEHRGIARAFDERIRSTLFAIYVIQIALGVVTFIIAMPTFWALGYGPFVSLALVAGTLQFLPIVGPSLLIAALAAYELVIGDPLGGLLVAVVGLVVVATIPDIVVRAWIATETANLPTSVYFIGFIGGLLSLGAIGIIVGPLTVAIVVESVSLLARELSRATGVERADKPERPLP